jgi:hypothetical protein
VVTQVPDGELTLVEQSLVECVGRGEWLDLAAGDEAVDEAAMRSWGDSRTCRASVIRDILRGRLAADPDPHGLRLRGAKITGRLDLANLTTDVSLQLRDCLLEEGVLARDARLVTVSLSGCQLDHPAEPALTADRLTCSVLDLSDARITGHVNAGAVTLPGAHIGGSLDCDGAALRNDSGPALVAYGLETGEGMFLSRGFTAIGAGENGAVNLAGARIGGSLDCDGAALRNDSGPALNAPGLEVDQGVFLHFGFTAAGAGENGAVRLAGARIGGGLDCDGAALRNDSGPALLADSLRVGQGVFFREGFTATGAGDPGTVRLTSGHIGGSLLCDGASLRNDSGPALVAYGLQVGLGVFLRSGFTVTCAGERGAIRLRGARIGASLDCNEAEVRNDCGPALDVENVQVGQDVFLGGVTATGAGDPGTVRLTSGHIGGSLLCDGASLRNDSGAALVADGLQVGQDMYLSGGFTATGAGDGGAVRLTGARVGGSVVCDGASLRNDCGPALLADSLEVDQDMQCDRLTADGGAVLGGHIGGLLSFEGAALNNRGGFALLSDGLRVDKVMFCRNGFTAQGEVRLPAARIGGRLYFDGARLSNPGGRALVASRLTVGQDLFCRTHGGPGHEQPFVAEGAVILAGARIGGHLVWDGAQLRNDSGPALHADSLQVDQDMLMRSGFTATGVGEDGAVRLSGARIGGSLEFDGASLRNDSGPALYADRLQVDQSMLLRDGFTAAGGGGDGAIVLAMSRIGGHLYCDGAALRNDSGPALDAYSLQVGQGMHLFDGFTATASSGFCAVNLTGAHIGARLLCDGASLRNDSGPALVAYGGLQVGQGVFFRSGFTATGAGESAAIALIGARIGGQLDCTLADLRNDSGPALSTGGVHIGQDMYLSGGFTATGGGADVAVDLTGVQVGGTLVFDPARLEHAADPHRRLAVDGLTYAGVPQQISAPAWLDLLRDGTPGYAAQPYQQLAAGYRALGDERQAREILMAQRDDELTRTDTRWPERWWGQITKVTLGYGYQPWRALLFLAAVVAVSCALAVALGSHGALAQTGKTATPGRSCTVVQQVSVGLDLNLPVGTTLARANCDLTTDSPSATAAWLTALGWVLRLLAWVFAALFIAGFTSAVRKT